MFAFTGLILFITKELAGIAILSLSPTVSPEKYSKSREVIKKLGLSCAKLLAT